MASYDRSTPPTSGRESPGGEARQLNNLAVEQYLLNKGFSERISRLISGDELRYWTEEELDDLFNDLDLAPDATFDTLASFQIQESQSGQENAPEFVKPTFEEIQSSAENLGALCVNRNGQFCLNPEEGFAALSHVWSQGLGADDENRGLHKNLLHQVFDRVEPLGICWIWVDSLAIPGGKRTLDSVEEALKGALINAMADIYRRAKLVVIFDALCMRLNSIDHVKVAVIACLGIWKTRMWTYQEIKLANNAIIVTKSGFVEFNAMTQSLMDISLREVGQDYMLGLPGKYSLICLKFIALRRNDDLGVSLPDCAFDCGNREAWDPLDYVRALFPTLRLEWKPSYSIPEAMHQLYLSQKSHATRLALYHGPPRASFPGWAPSIFNGLLACTIIKAGAWESRGMRRPWMTSRVKSIVSNETHPLNLELESDTAHGPLCIGVISEQTQKESPESILFFRKSASEGSAYLLADERFDSVSFSLPEIALLVARSTEAEDLEAWVCLTLAVGEIEKTYKAERLNWLLLHENPAAR